MSDYDLYREGGPEPVVSTAAMALLFGVGEELCTAEIERQRDNGADGFVPPGEWVRNGRRRRKEYEAATGRSDMRGAIEYWRERA